MATPVQGKHELHMRMLSQWVSGDNGADLLEDIVMPPEGEPCIDEPLGYISALLEQHACGQAHGRRIWHVGKWRVTPQVARLAEQPCRHAGVTGVKSGPAIGREVAEPNRVEFVGIHPDPVAGLMRDYAIATTC